MRGTTELRYDKYLTGVSIKYSNLTYIADQIFPIVSVNERSGLVPRFQRSHWYRDEAKPRAPGSRSEGGSWSVDDPLTYYCKRYSYRSEIDDEERANADDVFQLESNSTEFVTDKIQMRRERAFASTFFTTSVWTSDKTGGSSFVQWSDYATSSPMLDIANYQDEIEGRIGREANVLVLGKPTWNSLRFHPDFVELIKYTRTGLITEDLIREVFNVPKLLIGRALYTTDPEGTAEVSVTYTRIWGKHALLAYVPDSPSLNTPASGYTLTWNRVPNSIQWIKRMRDEEREVDIIEGNTYFDQRQTSALSGTFLANAVA